MDLFSHLAWIFHYFFSFYFRLKKRVALFSEIYVISIKCIITPPDWLNGIPRKSLKNDKFFDLEIYIVKLKYSDTMENGN